MDLSPSSLGQLNGEYGCPRAWEFEKVYKFPRVSNPSMELGTLCHNVIQDVLINGSRFEEVWETFLDGFLDVFNTLPEKVTEGYETEEMLRRGKLACELYLSEVDFVAEKAEVWGEKRIGASNVRGKLDLSVIHKETGEEMVIDLKTAKKTPTTLSPEYKLQGGIYALLSDIPSVRFDFLVLLKTPKIVKIELERPDWQVRKIKAHCLQAEKMRAFGFFPFRTSFKCATCAHWERCKGGEIMDLTERKKK